MDQDSLSIVARTSPFDAVYRGVLRALYEGRYVPGQRLAAPDLMQAFGVGRGTIREVLQRLVSTGVVTIKPHKGAQVRRLTRRETVGVLDIVELLLGLAARDAARFITDGTNRQGLVTRYATIASIQADTQFNRFLEAREDYYRFLVAASGNPELQRIFPSIQVQIMRVQLRSFDRAADSVDLADYTPLHDAVLSGDSDRAEREGRAHVRMSMERVAALPDRAFEAEP